MNYLNKCQIHTKKTTPDEDSSSEELEVDIVVGKRKISTRIEYKIRWKDYDSDDDSWEPVYNLGNAKAEIAKYEKIHKGK